MATHAHRVALVGFGHDVIDAEHTDREAGDPSRNRDRASDRVVGHAVAELRDGREVGAFGGRATGQRETVRGRVAGWATESDRVDQDVALGFPCVTNGLHCRHTRIMDGAGAAYAAHRHRRGLAIVGHRVRQGRVADREAGDPGRYRDSAGDRVVGDAVAEKRAGHVVGACGSRAIGQGEAVRGRVAGRPAERDRVHQGITFDFARVANRLHSGHTRVVDGAGAAYAAHRHRRGLAIVGHRVRQGRVADREAGDPGRYRDSAGDRVVGDAVAEKRAGHVVGACGSRAIGQGEAVRGRVAGRPAERDRVHQVVAFGGAGVPNR